MAAAWTALAPHLDTLGLATSFVGTVLVAFNALRLGEIGEFIGIVRGRATHVRVGWVLLAGGFLLQLVHSLVK